MTDLQDFLAARIYDDEQLALEILPARWGFDPSADGGGDIVEAGTGLKKNELGTMAELPHAMFVTQWDPARVLLECEAKRGILLDYMAQRRRYLTPVSIDGADLYQQPSDLPLKYLALPYREHPEYSEAWAPSASGTVETWGRR